MDYGSFNPKDPNQWAQFKQEGAQGVKGINAMPYVLGNSSGLSYPGLGASAGDPGGIKNQIYPGAAAAAAPAAPAPSSSLQSLLGLVNAGAPPELLMLGGFGGRGGGYPAPIPSTPGYFGPAMNIGPNGMPIVGLSVDGVHHS